MKVLLDEMLPIGVRQLLPEHEVMTAAYVGLAGVSNGEMISRAVSEGFDVIVSLTAPNVRPMHGGERN